MKTKHTKGEWEVEILPGGINNTNIISVQPSICNCSVKMNNPKEAEANAKLIVAAPELLEALQSIVSCNGAGYRDIKKFVDDLQPFINNAKKAIEKATK